MLKKLLIKLSTKILNKYNCYARKIYKGGIQSTDEQIQERGKRRLFKIIEDVVNENIDKDGIFNILFKNGSDIQNIPENCSIRGKRSKIIWVAYEDKKYNKYLKRVKNRQKLYDKLRKKGR